MPLPCTKHPGISWGFAMRPLGGRPVRLQPNSGQPTAGVGRARAGGGPGECLSSISVLTRAEAAPVGSARRSQAVSAARSSGPATRRPGWTARGSASYPRCKRK
jgi:hypothetical protein